MTLRLLAVYFAAAAGCLWLAHRFVSPMRPRVAAFLALAPFLLVGKAMLTGGVYAPIDIAYQAPPLSAHAREMGTGQTRTPILSDIASQHIPWRKAVRDAFKNGRLPLWNRFLLAGEPLLAVQQPVALYPATWVGMLLPLAQSWTFDMALRLFFAILAAYLFLRELGCGEVPALLGASAWAFSDYLIFFLGYPATPSASAFPLLLLGLRRVVSRADLGSVALMTASLLLIVISGHPETLLHAVAGGALYFLFELSSTKPAKWLRPFGLSLLGGALALGLSAVILLPLGEAMPQTVEYLFRNEFYAHADKTYPLREGVLHVASNLAPYLFGVSGKGEALAGFHEPSSYAGSILWPFVAAGLVFSKRREKWLFALLVALGVAIHARVPGIASALGALPLFNIGLNDRMIFLAAFGASALAALGAQSVLEERRNSWIGGASLLVLFLLGALTWRLRLHVPWTSMTPGYFSFRLLLQAVPLALLAAVALWSRRAGRVSSITAAGLLLLLAQRCLEEREFYPTYPNRAFYPPLAVFEKIPRRLPYRFTAVGFSFLPNIAALYELEDVRGYEAMTFRPFFETYSLWCVHQPVWFNRVDDPARPFLSFLNVRWVYFPPGLRAPPGWPMLFSGEDGVVAENPTVLPRAFAPRELLYEPNGMERLQRLSQITDFRLRGIVGEPAPSDGAAAGWRPNGQASVWMISYEAQRLELEIDAREASFIGTSETSWRGWKLTIDGRNALLLSYNHAFLGFRVPAGRHRAILRYWPDSVSAGLAISLLTLLACSTLAAVHCLSRTSDSRRARPPRGRAAPRSECRCGRRTTRSTKSDPVARADR